MNSYEQKEIFIFDVDGTIADSYGPVHAENAKIICNLLQEGKIVIFATSRSKESIKEKVLGNLSCGSEYFSSVYLLPAAGAAMYRWNNKKWQEVYRENIDEDDISKIISTYKNALATVDQSILRVTEPNIINKQEGVMLSCSALQPDATKEERLAWDKDHKKREQIIEKINSEFPQLDANVGGSATIDVTKTGVNKAYGLNKLFDLLKLDKEKALFVGDGFFPGGNDYCILDTGIETLKVESPTDCAEKLQMFLK